MQLAPEAFDPATVAMMGRVCDGAWHEATNRLSLFSCVSDAQHLMGERPQIELTLYRSDFGISSGLWRWKRNGCDATATAHTAQALSMKVPSRSSRAACRSWAVRVHHDRSLPGDGVPEAVSLKRAETGCLPRRPGPLPHRHCEENNGSAPTSSRLPRCKPSITTNAPHRSSASYAF
jgi:hypothetical protein